MAHYAFIDSNNIVVEVIVGRDEDDLIPGVDDWEIYYASKRDGLTCKRTSYNTTGGQHLLGGEPFRCNYAGIGYTYDEARDAFIPPKAFESWVLDEATCLWNAPVEQPGRDYTWNEETVSWDQVPMPEETDENGDPVPYVWDESVGEWVVSE